MLNFVLSVFKFKPYLWLAGVFLSVALGWGLYTLNLKAELIRLNKSIATLQSELIDERVRNKELRLNLNALQANLNECNTKISLQNERIKQL